MACKYKIGNQEFESKEDLKDYISQRNNIGDGMLNAVGIEPVVSLSPHQYKTDQWVGMAMRRVMQMAAQEGFDRVTWITGEQSADRYDLSKQVKSIEVRTYKTYKDITVKHNSGTFPMSVNNEGVIKDGEYKGKGLDEVIGKDLAEKILSAPKPKTEEQIEKEEKAIEKEAKKLGLKFANIPELERLGSKEALTLIERIIENTNDSLNIKTYEGEDLKVGGEGMKTFYNSILPKVAKKEAQRFDKKSKVEVVEINIPNEFNQQDENLLSELEDRTTEEVSEGVSKSKQLSIEITPKMKEAFTQGIPLFMTNQLSSEVYNPREGESYEQYRDRMVEEASAILLQKNSVQYFERIAKENGLNETETKSFIQRIKDFIKNFGQWLTKQLGLENTSPEEIANLTQRELFDRITTSMLREPTENIQLEYNSKGQHLAPNGKPSNLTEAQAKQVRTKAFQSWFGPWESDPQNASKVVDENGEPLVMYHSTKSDEFFEFDPNKIGTGAGINYGKGYYFESRKDEAKWYTQGEGRVIEVFLNSKTPGNYYGMTKGQREKADGVSTNLNEEDVLEGGQFMVKNPNQIKSATDNIGTFNPNNNDIRFSAQVRPTRSKISVGEPVIVENRGGTKTEGVVKRILTNVESHPYGIKVELEDGAIGRVVSVKEDKTPTGLEFDEKGFASTDSTKKEYINPGMHVYNYGNKGGIIKEVLGEGDYNDLKVLLTDGSVITAEYTTKKPFKKDKKYKLREQIFSKIDGFSDLKGDYVDFKKLYSGGGGKGRTSISSFAEEEDLRAINTFIDNINKEQKNVIKTALDYGGLININRYISDVINIRINIGDPSDAYNYEINYDTKTKHYSTVNHVTNRSYYNVKPSSVIPSIKKFAIEYGTMPESTKEKVKDKKLKAQINKNKKAVQSLTEKEQTKYKRMAPYLPPALSKVFDKGATADNIIKVFPKDSEWYPIVKAISSYKNIKDITLSWTPKNASRGGTYYQGTNALDVYKYADTSIVVHEMMHGVTTRELKRFDVGSTGKQYLTNLKRKIENPGDANPNVVKLAKLFIETLEKTGEIKNAEKLNKPNRGGFDGDNYGLNNLDEFVAEAFSNKEFMKRLNSISSDNVGVSLWGKFLKIISDLVNSIAGVNVVKGTVLEQVIQTSVEIMEDMNNNIDQNIPESGSVSPAPINRIQEMTFGDTVIKYTKAGNKVNLEEIQTHQEARGKGSARKALKQFLNITDKQKAIVKLVVAPRDNSTDESKLKEFYQSEGFEFDSMFGFPSDFEMIRYPQGVQTEEAQEDFTPPQPEYFDQNGEPKIEVLAEYATRKEVELTKEEQDLAVNMAMVLGVTTTSELKKVLNRNFVTNGFIVFDENKMQDLSESEKSFVLENIDKTERIVMASSSVEIPEYNTTFALKGTNPFSVENPYLVEEEVKQLVAGSENPREELTEEYMSLYDSNQDFKEAVDNLAQSNRNVKVFKATENELTEKPEINTEELLTEGVNFSNTTKLNRQLTRLLSYDQVALETNEDEFYSIAKEMEKSAVEGGLDLEGLADRTAIKPVTDTLDYLTNLKNFLDQNGATMKSFVETHNNYFGITSEPKQQTVSTEDANDVVVETELSEETLYEKYGLIRSKGSIFKNINKEPLEALYAKFYANDIKLNKDFEDIDDLKEYVQEQVGENETAESIFLFKKYFGIKDTKDSVNVEDSLQNFDGDYAKLSTDFISDFYVNILKNKEDNFYSHFKLTSNGIEVKSTDPLTTQSIIGNIPDNIREDFTNYVLISQNLNLPLQLEENPAKDISYLEVRRIEAVVNTEALPEVKNYQREGNIIATNTNPSTFVRISNQPYELVREIGDKNIYVQIPKSKKGFVPLGLYKAKYKENVDLQTLNYLVNKPDNYITKDNIYSAQELNKINQQNFNC